MNWKCEIMRSAAQSAYWLDYRYSKEVRRNALAYLNDIKFSDEVGDSQFVDDDSWGVKSLEDYMSGHHERKTGRYVYSTPHADRLDAITASIQKTGLLTAAALRNHDGPIEDAEIYAQKIGADKLADQRYFAGRLRGTFLGSHYTNEKISHVILIFHLIKGEEYSRIRTISVVFERDAEETGGEFFERSKSQVWDNYDVRDGFAATGTDFGQVFLLLGDDGFGVDFKIANYRWDTKHNRILGLDGKFAQGEIVQFKLCMSPDAINASIAILNSVSYWQEKSRAA